MTDLETVTLDFETTGVDTEKDRIISAFLRAKQGDTVVYENSWIIDPGVEVPEGAAEVHGMDTAWVQEHGRKDVAEAISEIANALADYSRDGFVISGFNHAFDLAMLNSELERHHGEGLETSAEFRDGRYIDPAIFSRVFDKYVKGGHQLITVAKRNGLEIEEERLHSADYDVEVTEKLVKIMLNRAWQELADIRVGLTPDEFVTKLQEWQATEKKKWAEHLTEYFESTGKTEDDGSKIVVSGAFPW